MNNKYEEVIKEKARYDKVKAIVEEKQRKLKKVSIFLCSSVICALNSNSRVASIIATVRWSAKYSSSSVNVNKNEKKFSIIILYSKRCSN